MFEGHPRILFELLLAQNAVAESALRAVYLEHEATAAPFSALLLEAGLIDKERLLQTVAHHLGCGYIGNPPAEIAAEIGALVDATIARSHRVVPIAKHGSALTLLSAEPLRPHLEEDLAFALNCPIRLAVADPDAVLRLIRQCYGEEKDAVKNDPAGVSAATDDPIETGELTEADIEKMAGQTPIIRFVNQVLAQAIRDRASDVHFEPFAQEFKIRYRVDGTLREMTPPARALALPIISRLKVLANLNIAERRLPQDGRIALTLDGRSVDLRISTLPTQCGESVVLRVLDQSSAQLDLGELGLPAEVRAGVEEIVRRPNGIFIVTGPTGSGKTTTLYSCLNILNTLDAKLLSVEDPVEYEIEGVMQVPVNPAAGLTFARALRTFLRQDPDVVMVGEIRDYETAQIAIQAALTGHLVLTTLHTNDAAGAVTRLIDMGIEPFLLASTVEAVLAQRLVRRVCLSCRTAFEPDDALLAQLGLGRNALAGRSFFRGTGCDACRGSGYKGRAGIFEFLRATEPLRELVVQGASLVKLRQLAASQGTVSLREAGIQAILAGETTVEEVVKYS